MTQITDFLSLHRPGRPLLCPNPWDAGSARLLAALGFKALATTSSGYAASLGRLDGEVGREEIFAHVRSLVDAVALPVSADLEDGYAPTSDGVAETIDLAIDSGLAGCSIEDWNGRQIYTRDEARTRVEAAARAAGDRIVLTARADNFFHGVTDLADTIARLRDFDAAGAHVLYAPGLERIDDIRAVVRSVSKPVNVLMRPNGPTVAELAEAGVARITVGGSFAFAAIGALVEAAEELRDHGTTSYSRLSRIGLEAVRGAFDDG
jgi:2-methylisocitrate lyase-like PEP mutase family enzyme